MDPEGEECGPTCEAMEGFEVVVVVAAEPGVCPCEDNSEHGDEDPRAGHVGDDIGVGVSIFYKEKSRFYSVHNVPYNSGDSAARVHTAVMEDLSKTLADAYGPRMRRA